MQSSSDVLASKRREDRIKGVSGAGAMAFRGWETMSSEQAIVTLGGLSQA